MSQKSWDFENVWDKRFLKLSDAKRKELQGAFRRLHTREEFDKILKDFKKMKIL